MLDVGLSMGGGEAERVLGVNVVVLTLFTLQPCSAAPRSYSVLEGGWRFLLYQTCVDPSSLLSAVASILWSGFGRLHVVEVCLGLVVKPCVQQ